MFSFFEGKNKCLGVDMGTTGIKIVELRKDKNVPVLTNYALSYDSGSLLQSSKLEMLDEQASQILKDVLKTGKFSTKKAVVSIPGFFALVAFMDLPEMPQKEMDQAVHFEANKYIPTPLEEVNLGWEMIGNYQEKSVEGGQPERVGQRVQVMVVTVPKTAVAKLSSISYKAGLTVQAMEVENFAAMRCLIGNDKGTFMIVNIGAKATDLTVVSDGVIRVTRSFDTGGAEISRALASGLGIDLQRADKIKKSSEINLLDPRNNFSGLIGPVVGMIVDEIKRLQEIYHRKNPLKKIEKIILTGGTSKLASLLEYISQQVSLECQQGNSLARVGVEKKYEEVMKEMAPELTVAIGLALRGLEEN